MTTQPDAPELALLGVARDAIAAALHGAAYQPPTLPAPYTTARRAVFVTLREPNGALRGCIGRTEPGLPNIAAEIADCAVSAATRDPRFPAVTAEELPTLSLELSLLEPTEPVRDVAELDARVYGVVVSSGRRRGVLLPDLDGVDTPAQQIAIALRKAGIPSDAPYTLERFRVSKIGAG